jgi:hypothetical protein
MRETDTFATVKMWLDEPQNHAVAASPELRLDLIKACVRFKYVVVKDYLTTIRGSGLIPDAQLLDIMYENQPTGKYMYVLARFSHECVEIGTQGTREIFSRSPFHVEQNSVNRSKRDSASINFAPTSKFHNSKIRGTKVGSLRGS